MIVPKTQDEQVRPHTILSQIRNLSTSFFTPSLDDRAAMDDFFTPTPTRPSSPQRRFKSIFANLASRSTRNAQPVRIAIAQTQIQCHEHLVEESEDMRTPRYEVPASPFDSESGSACLLSTPSDKYYSSTDFRQRSLESGSNSNSEFDDTPPLTPGSLCTDIESLCSPALANVELGYDYDEDDYNALRIEGRGPEDGYMDLQDAHVRQHSLEIKEGKKPARPVDFDALLADISVDNDTPDALLATEDGLLSETDSVSEEDKGEWYGLEYTLELSTRERRASETQVHSAGEHSKSRQSWAAIHQGTVHPFYEDQEFYQWKNWHHYLDRQDDNRKHRRGRVFKAHAQELAWCYADEMHIKDLIAWQAEMYGEAEKAVQERLKLLQVHRPDPYNPPHKHNLGWHLKRSRSVSSLRELRPSARTALAYD